MPFMGSEEAIQRNDALINALRLAPNVLFDRYREFGQVRSSLYTQVTWSSRFVIRVEA